MMATKTKQRPKTSVITDTGGMITTDLNEYLMRRSHVNYKDRFYPKEETDLMTTSAKKMQNLVAIEKKYIDNLETGKKEDIGRSYFFDDPNYDNLLGYSKDNGNNKYECGKEPWRLIAEEEKNQYKSKGLNNDLNNNYDGIYGLNGGPLKSLYMTDFTKKK